MTTITANTTMKNPQYKMNPLKFTMWVFLVTVTMLFAAFSSAMIVGRADAIEKGLWKSFEIPVVFVISTIMIVLSSISLQWAYYSAKKNEITRIRVALWLTIALGLGFLLTQWMGYQQLIAENVHFVGPNTGGSFFYVISGFHALHVIGGIFFLAATLISAYRYRVHSKSLLRINLCATYWHFIGVLWVYLFALLSMYR